MSTDGVAEGIVKSLARRGGNATCFFATEPSLGSKWLELLKEIVPGLRRVGVIFNPETSTSGTSYLHSVETAAPLFSLEATGAPVHHVGDIARSNAKGRAPKVLLQAREILHAVPCRDAKQD
jgi:putative ABC transport system substrate-binding protein